MKVQAFIEHIVNLSLKLEAGEASGTIADASLILLSAIETLAAELWPKGGSKKRFVELLARHSQAEPTPKTLSLPLLHQKLSKGVKFLDSRLKRLEGGEFSGDQSDLSEKEVLKNCEDLSGISLREYSYASVIYTELRCGFVHNYMPGNNATNSTMTHSTKPIRYTGLPGSRQIFVETEYLRSLLKNIDQATLKDIENSKTRGAPQKWWIQGAE